MIIGLAWRNLWRNRRRTILSAASVAAICLLLSAVPALQLGTYAQQLRVMTSLFNGFAQIQHPLYLDDPLLRHAFKPDQPLRQALENLPAGVFHAPRVSAWALLDARERSRGARIVGVDPASEPSVSRIAENIIEGRYLIGGAELILGQELAQALKVTIGDELTLLGSDYDGSFAVDRLRLVGVFDGQSDELDRATALIPLARFDQTFAMQGRLTAIVVTAPYRPASQAVRVLRKALPDSLRIHDWKKLQPEIYQAILTDAVGGLVLYAILIVMVSLTLINSSLLTTLERRREFGMMLSLGMRPGQLAGGFWIESLLSSLMGALLGLGLGAVLVAWFAVDGIPIGDFEELTSELGIEAVIRPVLSWPVMAAGPALLVLLLAIAALIPTQRIRRLEPLPAMRKR